MIWQTQMTALWFFCFLIIWNKKLPTFLQNCLCLWTVNNTNVISFLLSEAWSVLFQYKNNLNWRVCKTTKCQSFDIISRTDSTFRLGKFACFSEPLLWYISPEKLKRCFRTRCVCDYNCVILLHFWRCGYQAA